MSKQNYAVCCYTCEHNGQETCKGCNTILTGENEPYENWQLREDLCRKDEQIADLQHKLKVSEQELTELKQSQERLAITKLEKAKEFCEKNKNSDEYNYVIQYEKDDLAFSNDYLYLKDYIDDQLKELKGE